MAEPSLLVKWKGHPTELPTFCKTLLENNYLVDCTISAEGQYLKAHRVLLSACSPYFHMLFNDEREKHPIVILPDASFETLKAVIDFVYCGEVQIPQENLKAFLALAKALQIKGLNAIAKLDGNKDQRGSSTGNVPACALEDNQDNCGGRESDEDPEDNSSDLSQQHLHLPGGYTVAQTSSSVPFEGCSVTWDNVQSRSMVPPLPGEQINPECDEMTIETEISVKSEPLFSEFLESQPDLLNQVNSDEPKSRNLLSETEEETAPEFGQQDLDQFSCGGEFICGHVESTTVQPPPHHLQKKRRFSQPLGEKSPDPVVAKQPQLLLPTLLVPKRELNVAEWEEPIDIHNVGTIRDANETDKEKEPVFGERIFSENSSSVGPSPLLDKAAKRSKWRKDRRPHLCHYCQKTFRTPSILQDHIRTHTGERPFLCSQCGATFSKSTNLTQHNRIHAGERPFACEILWDPLRCWISRRGGVKGRCGGVLTRAPIATRRSSRPQDCDCTCASTLESGPSSAASAAPPSPDQGA